MTSYRSERVAMAPRLSYILLYANMMTKDRNVEADFSELFQNKFLKSFFFSFEILCIRNEFRTVFIYYLVFYFSFVNFFEL